MIISNIKSFDYIEVIDKSNSPSFKILLITSKSIYGWTGSHFWNDEVRISGRNLVAEFNKEQVLEEYENALVFAKTKECSTGLERGFSASLKIIETPIIN